jgi:predicted unusual protein kinase regulating ubiquinone biosynthesis (AarF/ABC1/UbiB family)
MSLCALKIPPIRKTKTWKFAGKFLWKRQFEKDQVKFGKWTRDQLIELGPTFIKLGQIASTRADLYPLDFINQLESLQDNVPSIDKYYVETMIKEHINSDMFYSFDYEPFKSASIGQVHKAVLTDGREVVVKLKRPDIYNIMKQDTDDVRDIVNLLEKIGVDTGTGSGYVLNESIEYLLAETDYEKEMENAIRFRKSFNRMKWVKVPKVYKGLSNENMIVMEYVESEKLADISDPDVNGKKVCQALINSYVIQTMDYGFFHADPHPGNIGFSKEGKLVFYDFGLIIGLSDDIKEGFQNIFISIINKDTKGIVDTLIKLGVILPMSSDTNDIELFFKTGLNYLETLDGKNLRDDILQDELLLSLAQTKPFIIPTSFVYLAKAFSTIEGTCVLLDPDFTYLEYLEPLIKEQVSDSIDIGSMLTTSVEMPSRIKNISTAMLDMEQSRASMKRSMEKSRKEMRYVQYSVLLAVFAGNLLEQYKEVSVFLTLISLDLALRAFRKNQ